MPPKGKGKGKGKKGAPPVEEINKSEKSQITDQCLTKPCLRCNSNEHHCIDCTTKMSSNNKGLYGGLSQGRKRGADKFIDTLKKEYNADGANSKFDTARQKRQQQEDQERALKQQQEDQERALEQQQEEDKKGAESESKEQINLEGKAQVKEADGFKVMKLVSPTGSAERPTNITILPVSTTSNPAFTQPLGQSQTISASQASTQQPSGIQEVDGAVSEHMQPPGEIQTARNIKQNPRNVVQHDSTVDSNLEHIMQEDLEFPKRETFSSDGRHVSTNHFEIDIKPNVVLHKYTVISTFAGLSKKKIKDFVSLAIEKCDFLNNNRTTFATDYYDTIISWVDLHNLIPEDRYKRLNGDSSRGPGSAWSLITLNHGSTTRHLTLQYQGTIDVNALKKYTHANGNPDKTKLDSAIKALNILISKCFDEAPAPTAAPTPLQSQGQHQGNPQGPAPTSTFRVGANKYFLKNSYGELKNANKRKICKSLETSRGFAYQVKPGVGKILLNIQTHTSASFKPKLLSATMLDRDVINWRNPLDLKAILKGLWVRIQYNRGDPKEVEVFARLNSEKARVKQIQGFGNPVKDQFAYKNDDGVDVTVKQHLERSRGKPLDHPELPAVNLGPPQNPRWYAPEDLKIMPFQLFKDVLPSEWTAGMIETACVFPEINAGLIGVSAMQTLGLSTQNASGSQQLPLCPVLTINPSLILVPSQKLNFPRGMYGKSPKISGKGNEIFELKAHWNTKAKRFFQVKDQNQKLQVTLLIDSRIGSDRDAKRGLSQFRSFAGPEEGNFVNYSVANIHSSNRRTIEIDPTNWNQLQHTMSNHLGATDLFLLVLRDKDYDAYSNFKDLADRQFGKHSICITAPKLKDKVPEKMGNIMMKLNLKLQGINHTISGGLIESTFTNTLVLGADVTHPGPSSITGCPSIAAVVGSVDKYAGRFLGSMRLQKESKKEIIDEIEDMVKERIIDWVCEQPGKKLPENILYYRDGVSDEQFRQVKNQELPRLRSAFRAAVKILKSKGTIEDDNAPVPKITAVICVKRHNVRFYPEKFPNNPAKDINRGNCEPGTLVDDVVTSPYYMDFYLQSHKPIQGTAKPAHYFVTENEMGMSEENIRQLTHELCYTYVRSTSGVSYAAPAYYADRLCERGRCYLRNLLVRSDAEKKYREDLDRSIKGKTDKQREDGLKRYGNEWDDKTKKRRKVTAEEEYVKQQDRKEIIKITEETVWEYAAKKFYSWSDGASDRTERNPWHEGISKTMFWM